jgi:glycosyltransferase involved in cell wall biosynthesis
MRVVQIIDSLETGGAEKMAVNYANALADKIEFSALVATRSEGLLLEQLSDKVSYLFINKKGKIDSKAILKLRKFIKSNNIGVIQAHSSSFFIAVLIKIIYPKVRIIWHDHYGISQNLKSRKSQVLKFSSVLFSGIISVNNALKTWAKDYLKCSDVIYLPNFIIEPTTLVNDFQLHGEDEKRIVCVANLRPQKNHELLIAAAAEIHKKFPDWTFHLIGKDFNDAYSEKLYAKVKDLKLSKTVFFYGAINNPQVVFKQCEIAVLPSLSEGLPLVILEYGLFSLPVIATNVGEIIKIMPSSDQGIIIESNNLNEFVFSISKLIAEKDCRENMGKNLYSHVKKKFSERTILNEYINWLKALN